MSDQEASNPNPESTPTSSAPSVEPRTLEQETEILRARDAKIKARREEQILEAKARQDAEMADRYRQARRDFMAAAERPKCYADRQSLIEALSTWQETLAERFPFHAPEPSHPECADETPHGHCQKCGCRVSVDLVKWVFSVRYCRFVSASEDSHHDLCPACERKVTFEDFKEDSRYGTKQSCGKCAGGWIVTGNKDDPSSWSLSRCECWATDKLPLRFRDASLSDFSPSVRQAVSAWWEQASRPKASRPVDGLFLTGPVGTGKTHLACALFKALRLSWFYEDALFEICRKMYQRVRSTYGRDGSEFDGDSPEDCIGGSESEIFQSLAETSLLVLDDIGAGSRTDFERRFLLEVLDERLAEKRLTVATSNFGLEEVAPKMDDRIASRLSALTQLVLSGPDRRLSPGPAT